MWQNGPEFLKQPVEEWPKKSAKEVAAYAKEGIDRLQRKSFSAALTRSQVRKNKSDGAAVRSSPVGVEDEKDHDVLQSSPEGSKTKNESDAVQKNKAKPRMNLTLCIHDSCDLPGFKNQEVKWEVSRQIKEHRKKKIIPWNIHCLSSKPPNLQGAAKVSVC